MMTKMNSNSFYPALQMKKELIKMKSYLLNEMAYHESNDPKLFELIDEVLGNVKQSMSTVDQFINTEA